MLSIINRYRNIIRGWIPACVAFVAGLASCSSDEMPGGGSVDAAKTAIEFSMGQSSDASGVSIDSRVGEEDSRAGFYASTRIVMRICSYKEGRSEGDKYTRTIATASAQIGSGNAGYSTVDFEHDDIRYWDDADGRDAKLSVYAVAIQDKTAESLLPADKFGAYTAGSGWALEDGSTAAARNTVEWTLAADQHAAGETPNDKDLVYSNNIKSGGADGVYRYDFEQGKYIPDGFPGLGNISSLFDGEMKFVESGTIGKFDRGHLIFRHALSRITVKLVKGDGFDTSPFAFTKSGTNVRLINVPMSGTFDVPSGTWSNVSNGDILYLNKINNTGDETYNLVGNTLPGREIGKDSSANIIEFYIDNNKYQVTEKMLYAALVGKSGVTSDGSKITAEQGKNYELRIKVSKQRIDNITATVAEWVSVTSEEMQPSNAYITLDLYDPTGTECENFDLYRLNDPSAEISIDGTYKHYAWYTGYNTDGAAYLEKVIDAVNGDHWSTKWFFEDNMAFYHFRTVSKTTLKNSVATATTITTDAANGDYFEIGSTTAADYDPHWGAPMRSGATLKYDATGDNTDATAPAGAYSASIHWGIGSTKSRVKITEMHIMSQVNVVLKTTAGPEKVVLKDAADNVAAVKLVRYCQDGKVELGRGMVKPTGTGTDEALFIAPTIYFDVENVATGKYFYNVVPQSLARGAADADYVGLEITTPDGNLYRVKKLSAIKATSVTDGRDQTAGSYITRWFPGHRYTYTFTLTKTGITDMTCTVTNWVDVTAGNEDVTIE
ncbi:MAG: fimbrillin family protein [Muribaculaceae bacterium]